VGESGVELNLHEALARDVATIAGVTAARVELGEVVAFAERDSLLLDPRTVRPNEDRSLLAALRAALEAP